MGCYRTYANGRSADLHRVTYELETATHTLKIEPEDANGPSRDRVNGYLFNISAIVRLDVGHACANNPFETNFAALDALYLNDKGTDGGSLQTPHDGDA